MCLQMYTQCWPSFLVILSSNINTSYKKGDGGTPYIFWITEHSLVFYRLFSATAGTQDPSGLYDGFRSNIH